LNRFEQLRLLLADQFGIMPGQNCLIEFSNAEASVTAFNADGSTVRTSYQFPTTKLQRAKAISAHIDRAIAAASAPEAPANAALPIKVKKPAPILTKAEKRTKRIRRLRKQGLSYAQIAATLGCSSSTVQRAVNSV
jgi:DNA-binding NarL/FixJ family response regulator